MKERERKFKLLGEHLPTSIKAQKPDTIYQGYLMLVDKRQLRIRLTQPGNGDESEGWLCFKHCNSSTDREEFEYKVPVKDASEMLQMTDIKLVKDRRYVGDNIVVDVYPDGKQVVEIEYDEELGTLPPYCGEEVTGNKEYSNIYIARQRGQRLELGV